ncbi:hypothetical protein IID20_00935 [Patescibacteria group bacterium]|nr:hypothetical protein [Patescibacteria group bacterium]
MNKFEQNSAKKEKIYSDEIEEIAFQAAEIPEFKKIIKKSKSRIEAIKELRLILPEHFPEISNLPKPERPQEIIPKEAHIRIRLKDPFGLGPASNEFMIAKYIIDLLWQEK